MHPERWQRCTDIFNLAVERPPNERAAFLDRSCDGDEALRREVELLLKYHDASGDFIKSPVFEAAPELLVGDPEALIGQHLGCYRVEAVAGVGGMGVVYLAWDERLGRKVALKLLPQSMVANGAQLGRLKREARTASTLNHPNIVTIHDIGEVDSTHYVATEFIEGTTLRERMTKGPIPPNEAVDIAAQVASALCVAHRAGIVHRDIKPENIMLRPDGYVKVLDFGIAKLTQQETLGTTTGPCPQVATQQSMVLGTTRYMSPEQAMAQQVDARSDLWSLGVVLYEMLAGRTPFEGETVTDVIAAIFDSDPQPLTYRAPIVPPALQSVVDRSLRKDPAERYQTAEEMLSELRAIKAGVELPVKSIAVLPFDNQNRDPGTDYLSDGIPESIINSLSQLPQLRVMARSTVFSYKSKDVDPRKVGNELGVRVVLMGRLIQRGDNLAIRTELVNVADGTVLWGQQYNRKLADVFAVQEEIAREISEKLRLKLTGAERQQLAKRPTENLKAFQYYMQGQAYAQRSIRDDLLTAIRYYQRAIEEDPNYALAYAGLADAYAILGIYGYIAPIEGRRKAEEAAHKALALDDNLAEAHFALSQANIWFAPGNFSLGDGELRRAIELSPSLALAHLYLAVSLVRQGRLDESLEEFLKARELDPLSSIIARGAALPYYFKPDYARALELLREANELGPALSTTFEIGIYIQNRSFNEALAELEKAKRERKNDSILTYDTGMIYAAQGKRAEALQIIKELEEMSGANLSQAHWIAKIYAALNEKELAFSWLGQGLGVGAIGAFYKDEPVWDPIRSDPQFTDLLRRMGIPQ
jgi:serine/threonine protein kinase/tetratricopeptide (TPR) repeat protein